MCFNASKAKERPKLVKEDVIVFKVLKDFKKGLVSPIKSSFHWTIGILTESNLQKYADAWRGVNEGLHSVRTLKRAEYLKRSWGGKCKIFIARIPRGAKAY